jgi:deoxyribonuclease V
MPLTIYNLHRWDVSYKEAVDLQETLQFQLSLRPLGKPVHLAGGIDVSYSTQSARLFAAVVIVDLKTMGVIEECTAEGEEEFKYIPGLLSFREIPILLKAITSLQCIPDVFILDGQGIAHPHGLGLASHFGLWIDVPTVGCAKSKLVGEYIPFAKRRGTYSGLCLKGKTVGAVVCTKDGINPVFVSPGNRSDIESSIEVVLKSCRGYKLPEPIRKAHALATSLRDREPAS